MVISVENQVCKTILNSSYKACDDCKAYIRQMRRNQATIAMENEADKGRKKQLPAAYISQLHRMKPLNIRRIHKICQHYKVKQWLAKSSHTSKKSEEAWMSCCRGGRIKIDFIKRPSNKSGHSSPLIRRDSQEIRTKRREYCTRINEEQQLFYLQNCVFVDETGFNLHINRTQARQRRGLPARIKVVPSSKGRNLTVFAAMSHAGLEISAVHCNRGTTKQEQFNDFVDCLIRHLNQRGLQGYHVIFDNAPIHGTSAMNKLVAAGYRPQKVSPWSPFLNPIEELFSKLKQNVKRHQLRHHEELLQRIRESSALITFKDTFGKCNLDIGWALTGGSKKVTKGCPTSYKRCLYSFYCANESCSFFKNKDMRPLHALKK